MSDYGIRAYNATWRKFKNVWPTNSESNPWEHLLEQLDD